LFSQNYSHEINLISPVCVVVSELISDVNIKAGEVSKQRFLEWPKQRTYCYKEHCNDASQMVKKSGEGLRVEKMSF